MEVDTEPLDSEERSPSEYFNQIIGCIEDIVISSEFQKLHTDFLEKHYKEFSSDEENKMSYTDIFNEYTTLIEDFIVRGLRARMPDIDLDRFLNELRSVATTFDGEIYELLFSLSDFQTFKSVILDYKEFKNNARTTMALSDCFVVTKLGRK